MDSWQMFMLPWVRTGTDPIVVKTIDLKGELILKISTKWCM